MNLTTHPFSTTRIAALPAGATALRVLGALAKLRQRAVDSIPVLVPALALLAVRTFVLYGGPDEAEAANADDLAPPALAHLTPWTPLDGSTGLDQLFDQIREAGPGHCPFTGPRAKPDTDHIPQLVVHDPIDFSAAPDLRLSALLGGPTPAAVIDGRLLRTGQAVAPGWKLAAIEPDDRLVRIEHLDGRAATIAMPAEAD